MDVANNATEGTNSALENDAAVGEQESVQENAPTEKTTKNIEDKPDPFKYKFKVYGEEREFNLADQKDKDYIQKAIARERKFEELARKERELSLREQEANKERELIKRLQENPDELENFLHDVYKKNPNARTGAEKFLLKHYEKEIMTAEQRRLAELEEENKRYKMTEEQKRKQEEEEKQAKVIREQETYLDKLFTEKLNQKAIPKTNHSMAKMAYYTRLYANQLGKSRVEDVDFDYITDLVNKDLAIELGHHMQNGVKAFKETMLKYVGKKVLDNFIAEWRQEDLNSLKSSMPNYANKSKEELPVDVNKISRENFMTPRQAKQMLDKKYR